MSAVLPAQPVPPPPHRLGIVRGVGKGGANNPSAFNKLLSTWLQHDRMGQVGETHFLMAMVPWYFLAIPRCGVPDEGGQATIGKSERVKIQGFGLHVNDMCLRVS